MDNSLKPIEVQKVMINNLKKPAQQLVLPQADLHGRFLSALTAEQIMDIALNNDVLLTTSDLCDMGIKPYSLTSKPRDNKLIRITEILEYSNGECKNKNLYTNFLNSLSLKVEYANTTLDYEEKYLSREIILKLSKSEIYDVDILIDVMNQIAKNYKAKNQNYCELTCNFCTHYKFLQIMQIITNEIKLKTGVDIRFLGKINRGETSMEKYVACQKLMIAMKISMVAGCDFIGSENEDEPSDFFVEDIATSIMLGKNKKLLRLTVQKGDKELKKIKRSLMVIKEVKEKLRLSGVRGENLDIRIVQTVAGKYDTELLNLIAETGCAIEFNLTSEYSTTMLNDFKQHPVCILYYAIKGKEEYNKIRIILGTENDLMYFNDIQKVVLTECEKRFDSQLLVRALSNFETPKKCTDCEDINKIDSSTFKCYANKFRREISDRKERNKKMMQFCDKLVMPYQERESYFCDVENELEFNNALVIFGVGDEEYNLLSEAEKSAVKIKIAIAVNVADPSNTIIVTEGEKGEVVNFIEREVDKKNGKSKTKLKIIYIISIESNLEKINKIYKDNQMVRVVYVNRKQANFNLIDLLVRLNEQQKVNYLREERRDKFLALCENESTIDLLKYADKVGLEAIVLKTVSEITNDGEGKETANSALLENILQNAGFKDLNQVIEFLTAIELIGKQFSQAKNKQTINDFYTLLKNEYKTSENNKKILNLFDNLRLGGGNYGNN